MSTRRCSELARALAAALALLGAAGCQRVADPPEVQAARAAVARYNDRLPAVFRTRDQSLLGDAATEAETDRVGAIVAGLASRGEVMIARLEDTRVVSARAESPARAVVETVETWRYEHRAASAPERPVRAQERTYQMTYAVGLHEGGWKVEHAAVEAERARDGK